MAHLSAFRNRISTHSATRTLFPSRRKSVLPRGSVLRASNGTDTLRSSDRRQDLQRRLQVAVNNEAYAEAAALKKQLDELDQEDPVLQLKSALQQAIAEERFKDAARLQAELRGAEAAANTTDDTEALSNSSNAVTQGVRVIIKSFFVPSRSAPLVPGQWFFAYHVTISNEGDQVVQLRSRHWKIVDGNGHREEVRGPGVVGVQPILLPGKKYEYMSACPLPTPTGSMEGTFSMVVLREMDGEFADAFDACIGRFGLNARGDVVE